MGRTEGVDLEGVEEKGEYYQNILYEILKVQ